MDNIKFGTDGWRAIIADTYTNVNVARVAYATAKWVKTLSDDPSVVVGYDCRFGGPMFADITARILCNEGIRVYYGTSFVSTPMVSLATRQLSAQAGVIITASHNPPSYNGYKLKAHFGGPAVQASISEVEALIPDNEVELPAKSLKDFEQEKLLVNVDFEQRYMDQIEAAFDMPAIHKSGIRLAYDAMYGAGQNAMRRLFPNASLLHCDFNPSFMGQAPEPIHKNLTELSNHIKEAEGKIKIGLANDGDADRIGLYDSSGNFVDSHHIILLLIHYLSQYKNQTGKIVIAFSVTDKVKKMCAAYGLPVEVTKIGFKHICEIMVKPGERVLVGGEESGGIAVDGHIPERDGIWMGLLILEFMAKTGKSLEELIQEVYDVVGAFSYNRNDLHITNELKASIMENCKNGVYKSFGKYTVDRLETIDGYKYHFDEDRWIMIRPSGTEPVLRVYAEAPDSREVEIILREVKNVLLH